MGYSRLLRGWCLLLVVSLAGCREPMHGVVIGDPEPAPPLVLTPPGGAAFDLAKQRGSIVLIYFGYTHCPDVCPTMLSDWARAKRAIGEDSTKVRFVFVSVDPERDTPEIAAAYAKQFDRSFIGLSGTPAEIEAMKRAWKIAAYPEGDPRTKSYTVAHPSHSFLVDEEGVLRLMYRPGVRSEELAQDLQRLF